MYEAMLVLSVVIFAAVLLVYIRHPAASIFHPLTFYMAFHGLVFVVRPIFAWYFDFNGLYLAVGFTPTVWDKVRVLFCTNLSFVVFAAVSLWAGKDALVFKQDEADREERGRLLNWFSPFAIALIFIGIYVTWWLIQFRLSGAMMVEKDELTGEGKLASTNGYFLGMGMAFGAVSAVIAYLGRFRLWSFAPFAIFALLRFATGSRGPVVVIAVLIGLTYLYDQRKRWPKASIILPAAALILVFNAVQSDRGLFIRNALGLDTRYDFYSGAQRLEGKPFESMDIANMENFEFLIGVVPEKTGTYDYFVANLQLFVAPIPRALWKDKPVGAPIKMFEIYRFGNSLGVTFAVPGMGWYYLGYVGVIIWSALFAFIYAYGYRLFARGKQTNVAVLAYCTLISTSVIAFRDGVLYTVISQLLFYFIPIGICLFILKLDSFPSAEALRLSASREKLRSLLGGDLPLSPRARRLAIAGQGATHSEVRHEVAQAAVVSPQSRRRSRMKEQK